MDLTRGQVERTILQQARRAASENDTLREAETEATSAQAMLEEALSDSILQAIRAFLNIYASETFNVHMKVREVGGLYESLSGNVIATTAIKNLYQAICRMNGVSIGLAGPRGAGKSTAIQYLYERLTPVAVTPRDLPGGPDERQWNQPGI